jgi:predicted metalloprotease
MCDFMKYVFEDVHSVWTGVWTSAGYPEPQTTYSFPGPGEVVVWGCGQSNDATAAYCPIDDHLVISQVVATEIWEGVHRTNPDPDSGFPAGDFSVAYAVAHEYAHHLQDELGLVPSSETEPRRFPVYKRELHADCWAGVWAKNFEDEQFHGTPEQRRDAFLTGWNSGVPVECDTYLLGDY